MSAREPQNPYETVRSARRALASALRELAQQVRRDAERADGQTFYRELARAQDLEREASQQEQDSF